jgi:multiple sugar transport system permease protein
VTDATLAPARRPQRRRNRTRAWIGRAGRVALGAAITTFALFPLYWMAVQAVRPETRRFDFPPSILPTSPTIRGLVEVITERDAGRWLVNSFVVSFAAAAACLVIAAWGAYAISRFRTRGTGAAAYLTLATQMMPPVVLMIPLYKAFISLHLVGGLTGLVVANLFFHLPVTVWMLKSVIDSVPEEIEDAARVDGCNRLEVLVRVTLPLALPGVVAAGIFAFIGSWEEYLFARVLITAPEKWVGSIGIGSFFGEFGTSWAGVMSASLLFTAPPIVLFLLVQRQFVDRIAGGVKG